MDKILIFLDGKKAVIGNILQVINVILVTSSIYSQEIGIAIASLILAITGVGVAATSKVLGSRQRVK